MKDPARAAREMADFVNRFGDDHLEAFARLMGLEHRTLQQSFTKLALVWLEKVSADDYGIDLRNRDSHETAKKLLSSVDYVPSKTLRNI